MRAIDGEEVARVTSPLTIAAWSVGPAAEVVAFGDDQGAVNFVDSRQDRSLGAVKLPIGVLRIMGGKGGFAAVGNDNTLWWMALGLDGAAPQAEYLGRLGGGVSVVGDQLAFVAADGLLQQVDFARRAKRQLRYSGPVGPGRVTVGAKGELAFANAGLLKLWQRMDTTETVLPAAQLTSAVLDPEGELILVGDALGHVRPLVADGTVEDSGLDYIGHGGAVTSLASQSTADLAASGGTDGVVRLWSLSSGAPREFFMRHPSGPISQVAISGDGRWLASAADYGARVWDTADGAMVSQVAVTGRATAVTFAPTNELLAVGDVAGNVQLVATRANNPLRAMRAKGAVTSIAFSRSAQVLASGTREGTLQLWTTASAEQVGEPLQFSHPIRSIVFSPDDERIVVQTLHWVHWVSAEGLQIEASRLAPIGARPGPVVVSRDGSRLRLLASHGGRPAVINLTRNRRPLTSAGSEWLSGTERLGLTLNTDGQLLRR